MRIALTGATGFAGRVVVNELVSRGHSVVALVRDPARATTVQSVKLIRGDLNNKSALNDLLQGTDTLVHLAGAISARNRQGYFAINQQGTRQLMEVAASAPVKRIIHISSMAAREPDLSDYAASKAAAETEVDKVANQKSVLILRPSAIYGPGDQATLPLIQQLLKNTSLIPGTSQAKFALIHVTDFAHIVAEAAESSRTGTIEVDDADGPHDWQQLMSIANKNFGTARRAVFVPRTAATGIALIAELVSCLSNTASMTSRGKIRELYHSDWSRKGAGWPRNNPVPLEQGLVDTITWYAKNGLIRTQRQPEIK